MLNEQNQQLHLGSHEEMIPLRNCKILTPQVREALLLHQEERPMLRRRPSEAPSPLALVCCLLSLLQLL